MGSHLGCRHLGVAALDRCHHRAMLGVRFGEAAERLELGAAERGAAFPHGDRKLGEEAVVRTAIERLVEAIVEFDVGLAPAGRNQTLTLLLENEQMAPLLRRHGDRRPAGAERLEFGHDREYLVELTIRQGGYDRAALCPRLNQPDRLQLADRLADRRARDAEGRGDHGLVERGARREPAVDDVVGDGLMDQFRLGQFRHGVRARSETANQVTGV